jgi:hypothetical protein
MIYILSRSPYSRHSLNTSETGSLYLVHWHAFSTSLYIYILILRQYPRQLYISCTWNKGCFYYYQTLLTTWFWKKILIKKNGIARLFIFVLVVFWSSGFGRVTKKVALEGSFLKPTAAWLFDFKPHWMCSRWFFLHIQRFFFIYKSLYLSPLFALAVPDWSCLVTFLYLESIN